VRRRHEETKILKLKPYRPINRQKALQATAAGTTYCLSRPAGVSMQFAGHSAISIIGRRHGRYQQQCSFFVWPSMDDLKVKRVKMMPCYHYSASRNALPAPFLL
jgi:hypothetical protein